MLRSARSRRRQRGWLGLAALLLALVIVALLAQGALKQYGAASLAAKANAVTPAAKGDAAAPGVKGDAAEQTPMERARAVESTVQKQAEDLGRRIDDSGK